MRIAPLFFTFALACAVIPGTFALENDPEAHVRRRYRQRPTWAQRFDRLGVLFSRFGREVDDTVSDLWKDVTDEPETRLGRAGRQVKRDARDLLQRAEDEAMDAKWKLQQSIPRETFWSKFRRFLSKEGRVEIRSKRMARRQAREQSRGEKAGKNSEGWIEPRGGLAEEEPSRRAPEGGEKEEKEEKNPGVFGVFAIKSLDDALEKLGEASEDKENNGGNNGKIAPITLDLEQMKVALDDAKDAFKVFAEKAQVVAEDVAEKIQEANGNDERWVRRDESKPQINLPTVEDIEKAAEDVKQWIAKPAEEKKRDIDQFVDSIGERLIKQREAMAAQIRDFSAKVKKNRE